MSPTFRIYFLLMLFLPLPIQTQTLHGKISAADGRAVAYASVYVPLLKKGTTANSDGDYLLPLPEGEHQVVVQYLGYASYRKQIELRQGVPYRLDVVLQPQAMALPEVIVTASGEDPAAFIMRKAIALGPYYRSQLDEYKARVYVKGTGLPEKIPALLRPQLKRDGIREGQYIVTETLSEIQYRRGQPLQTKVLSTRSSGFRNEDLPMQFATLSLYNDINGVISPLSRNAFSIYRFRLEGTYLEDGRSVSRIRVIPRRNGQDVYSGTIMIREGSWNLQAVDLVVTTNLYELSFRQVYQEIQPLVWMPVSHDYKLAIDALGGKGTFRYIATLSDITVRLNPQLDHQRFARMMEASDQEKELLNRNLHSSGTVTTTARQEPSRQRIEQLAAKENISRAEMREMNRLITLETKHKKPQNLEIKPRNTEIADSARLRTPDYWANNRPVPLTAGEAESFGEDSLKGAKKDTLKRNPLFTQLIFGKNNYKIDDRTTFSHNGFADYSAIGFNTIDGLLWSQRIGLVHDFKNARRLKPFIDVSYAFARQTFNYSFETEFLSGPMSRTRWNVSAGRVTSDYNSASGIEPFMNAVTTLFLGRYWMKLYEKDFATFLFTTDIVNGLNVEASFEFANRKPIANHSTFAFYTPPNREFTPNIPPSFLHRPELFEVHRASIASFTLSWTPEHYYRIRDGRKQMAYSRYPTLSLKYNTGLPKLAGSDMQFSQWEFSMRHSITRRLFGTLGYGFAAGLFTDTTSMRFQDFRHFRADPLLVGEEWRGEGFRSANYYTFSTNKPYAVLHASLNSRSLIIKRIPSLALRSFNEQFRVAARFAGGSAPVIEFGYGLTQLFFFANAEVFFATGSGLLQQAGFNISIPISRLVP